MELLLLYFLTLLPIICCKEDTSITIMRVKQDEDVVLPCSSGNTRAEFFVWMKDFHQEVFLYVGGRHYNKDFSGQDPQFKGRVFHFEDQLQSGNASIVIRNTKVTDSGSYSCEVRHHQSSRHTVMLFVEPVLRDRTGETFPGLALRPHVAIIDQTKDWALLQCEVEGAFPEPAVEWLDSDDNIVPSKGKQERVDGVYNIILTAHVTKTDHYRCVVTQNEINHETYTKIFVYINVSEQQEWSSSLNLSEEQPPDIKEEEEEEEEKEEQWLDHQGETSRTLEQDNVSVMLFQSSRGSGQQGGGLRNSSLHKFQGPEDLELGPRPGISDQPTCSDLVEDEPDAPDPALGNGLHTCVELEVPPPEVVDSYICTICGRAFAQRGHWAKHVQVHRKVQAKVDKSYTCDICGKRLTRFDGYQKHLRIHTGEKPYCCNECGRRFSDNSNYKRHIRTHSAQKPPQS